MRRPPRRGRRYDAPALLRAAPVELEPRRSCGDSSKSFDAPVPCVARVPRAGSFCFGTTGLKKIKSPLMELF